MFQENVLGGSAARTVPPTHLALDAHVPACLQEHGERLRFIAAHSPVLTRGPLEDEIERLEEILEALTAAQQWKEVTG